MENRKIQHFEQTLIQEGGWLDVWLDVWNCLNSGNLIDKTLFIWLEYLDRPIAF